MEHSILTFPSTWAAINAHFSVLGPNDNGCQAARAGHEDEELMIYERDPWEELQPIMAKMPVEEIMRVTGCGRRMAYAVKKGERRLAQKLLEYILEKDKGL